MPAIPTYLLIWSPARETYELSAMGKQKRLPIVLDSPEWFAWLERTECFVFAGQNGRYTVGQKASVRGFDISAVTPDIHTLG